MQEILYFYDGSFEGFLSCVFESYAHHERPTAIESDEVPTLFASRWVETEVPHAQRVLRKLHAVSPWGLELVRRGFLTCLEERERLSISGVEEVESFDENTIIMTTVKGTLVVRGEDLHIEKLSLDGGDLRVEGVVDSLSYEDDSRERGGFFARLLR